MKILFIYPPYEKKEVFSYLSNSAPLLPPLGLAYLAAYIRKYSYEVSIIDSPTLGLNIEEVVNAAISQEPKLIAITANSPLYSKVLALCQQLKENLPNTKIVLGGYHPTFLAEEVLNNSFIDFIIRGEGEEAFLELCKTLENNCNFSSIKGLGFKKNGKVILNQERKFIEDLDILPFPAYDLLPLDSYRPGNNLGQRGRMISLIASRGCTGNCYFCTSPGFWRNTYRKHSPSYVVSLMDYLYQEFDKNIFHFRDDTFTLDKKWVIEFCNLLIKKNNKYRWDCYTRFDKIDKELLKIMRKAGCYQLSLGVESSDPEILDKVKGLSLNQIYKNISLLKKYKFKTRIFFMVGPPAKTKKDIDNIADFAIKLDPDILIVTATIPYPGSAFYQSIVKKRSKLPFDTEVPKVYEGFCSFDNFDIRYIKEKVRDIYKKFYLRPGYIIKRLIEVKNLNQIYSLGLGGISLFKMLFKKE